jgi:thioredoxin 1
MNIEHVKESEYADKVKEGIVLVDFYADWCGPCKMLAPQLETLANQRSNIKIIKVNVDENSNLVQSFGILSMPTMLLYKDGKVVSTRMGFHTIDMLNEWVESIK